MTLQLNKEAIALWRENSALLGLTEETYLPPAYALIGAYLGLDLVNLDRFVIAELVENFVNDSIFIEMESPYEIAASMVNKVTYIPYEDALKLVGVNVESRPSNQFLQVLDCYLETGIIAWEAFD